jgi:hypothetical protein
MAKRIVINLDKPTGVLTHIHDDRLVLKNTNPHIRRMSNVEPVEAGPNTGRWYVDFSPMGEKYQYCLAELFLRREDALVAEHQIVTEVICGQR